MISVTDSQCAVLRCHRDLDLELRKRDRKAFISGWQTESPYSSTFFATEGYAPSNAAELAKYALWSDDSSLADAIVDFHARIDQVCYDPKSVLPAPGASPLVFALLAALKARGIDEVFYVPPLYYTFYYFANLLGIKLNKVSDVPIIGPSVCAALPTNAHEAVLVMSDPLWMMGVALEARCVEAIGRWQKTTGSVVVVDGTFQYLKWGHADRLEQTSRLDRDLTMRLVCPTKSLALHGFRFAYLLFPLPWREDLRYPCSNVTGANGSIQIGAAHAMIKLLGSQAGNQTLLQMIETRYKMIRQGFLEEVICEPDASYYAFGRVRPDYLAKSYVMDQRFFELTGHPEYVRVNLLMPESEWNVLQGKCV